MPTFPGDSISLVSAPETEQCGLVQYGNEEMTALGNRTSHLMVLTFLPFGQSRFAASRSSRETVLVSSPINSREGAKNAKEMRWVDLVKTASGTLAKHWSGSILA